MYFRKLENDRRSEKSREDRNYKLGVEAFKVHRQDWTHAGSMVVRCTELENMQTYIFPTWILISLFISAFYPYLTNCITYPLSVIFSFSSSTCSRLLAITNMLSAIFTSYPLSPHSYVNLDLII